MDRTFEPAFLKSILVFGSNLRTRASVAMRDAFETDGTAGEDRRLLYLSIRQQTCMAMEDVGAYLYAFQQKQKNGKDFLDALTGYQSHKVYLFNLFDGKTDEEIAEAFGFSEIPAAIQELGYTEAQNVTATNQFVEHFQSLAKSQKQMHDGCMKLKHGGTIYYTDDPAALRVLMREEGEIKPKGIHYNADELRWLVFVSIMCSIQIKELVFRYIAIYHPKTYEEVVESDEPGIDYKRATDLLESYR